MGNATRSKWPSLTGAVGGSCFSIISFVFSSECVVHSASNLLLRVESCQPGACQSACGSLSLTMLCGLFHWPGFSRLLGF